MEAKGDIWKRKAVGGLAAVEAIIKDIEMNAITLYGRVLEDAESILVKSNGEEMPLVTFVVIDKGVPYTKTEPMTIEVDFIKEPAMHILPFLKKGKEVVVSGILRKKKHVSESGVEKVKYFISAEYVILTGHQNKKNFADEMKTMRENSRRFLNGNKSGR